LSKIEQFSKCFGFFSEKPNYLSKVRKGVFNLGDSYVSENEIQIKIEVPDPFDVLFVTDFGLTLFYAGNPNFTEKERQGHVLDIGFGCGVYPIVLEKIGFQRITGIDINPNALVVAHNNIKINNCKKSCINLRHGSFPEDMKYGEKYELIIANSSHLPSVKGVLHGKGIDQAILGGPNGRSMLDKILDNVDSYLAKNGRLLIVHSSLCGLNLTKQKLKAIGYNAKLLFEHQMTIPFFAYPNEREALIRKELIKLRDANQSFFSDKGRFLVHVIEIKRSRELR
jgi:release factor glutamine methyltransferase